MIQGLKVIGLNDRFDYEFPMFFEDMNLLTGSIGTGKTTLLKLIWYLTSGNIQRALYEIPFQSVLINTSRFSLSIKQTDSNQFNLIYIFTESKDKVEFDLDLRLNSSEVINQLKEPNESIASTMDSSLFFPTFRRMERNLWKDISGYANSSITVDTASKRIVEALSDLSEELSVGNHKFIAAISTYDLIDLLTGIDARISKDESQVDHGYATLVQPWKLLGDYETLAERWKMLNEIVAEIYNNYSGICIAENLILGSDTNKDSDPIPSQNLSSGEKQLLGFLCYNGFFDVKTIFIDEPELSLHPDWQRLLISLLTYQGTEKQFFIASHSPYIGSKYEDKQFMLERPKEGENE